MIRKIIHIDEEKCNGCGLCASACHEGAIDIVDGKANAESIVVDHSGRVIASTSIAPQLTSVKIQELVDAAEKMEYLLGSHVEMEIQVYNQTLYFLQVRKLL